MAGILMNDQIRLIKKAYYWKFYWQSINMECKDKNRL